MKNLERIKQLFSELHDLALETWPPLTVKQRHCATCKMTWGIWSNAYDNHVIYCQQCGAKLENVNKPSEYHWPHSDRLYAMLNYRMNKKKKNEWEKVVDATDHEFHFMKHH